MQSPTIFYASYKEPMENTPKLSDFIKESKDISGAIYNYQQARVVDLSYSLYDIMDTSGNLRPQNTLQDARLKDLQNILIQENTLYIVGVVTTASLIFAAIFILKSFKGVNFFD